jgi:hypothetical protein
MDEHFERVMDLASQGRFEEARKYIQEADIPPGRRRGTICRCGAWRITT